jgi:hypothetical protein
MKEVLTGARGEMNCDTWWLETGIIWCALTSVIYVCFELCGEKIPGEIQQIWLFSGV